MRLLSTWGPKKEKVLVVRHVDGKVERIGNIKQVIYKGDGFFIKCKGGSFHYFNTVNILAMQFDKPKTIKVIPTQGY